MATRRVMVGDQEIKIPEFNFKLMPVVLAALAIWLLVIGIPSSILLPPLPPLSGPATGFPFPLH